VRQVSFTLLVEFYATASCPFLKPSGQRPSKRPAQGSHFLHGGGRINDGGRFDALS
jgi:hypothetical protein